MPKVNKINEFIPPEDDNEERWAELRAIEKAFEEMETPMTDEGVKAESCPDKGIIIIGRPFEDNELAQVQKDLDKMVEIL